MTFERRHGILEILRRDGSVTLKELGTIYSNVSEMTLRRDLEYLEKLGEAVRIKGGARHISMLVGERTDEVYSTRITRNREGKEKTASIALRYVETGRSIYLDSGTTVRALARTMPDADFTVLTRGFDVALELTQKENPSVNIIGGLVNRDTQSVSGMQALEFVKHLNFDLAFMSASAFSLGSGFSSGNYGGCEFKKHIVSQAKFKIMMLDSEKFDKVMPFTVADLSDFDVLVTDKKPSDEVLEAAEKHGVEVLWE